METTSTGDIVMNGEGKYVNYGRVGNSEEFEIAYCDNFGVPLIMYRAYWSYKWHEFTCYPKKVLVPGGSYRMDKFKLQIHQVMPRWELAMKG